MHSREQMAPWVESIVSRLVLYCFSCGSYVSPAGPRAAGRLGVGTLCVCVHVHGRTPGQCLFMFSQQVPPPRPVRWILQVTPGEQGLLGDQL